MARKKAEPKPIEETELTEEPAATEQAAETEQAAPPGATEEIEQELKSEGEDVVDAAPGGAAEQGDTPDAAFSSEDAPISDADTALYADADGGGAVMPPDAEFSPDALLESGAEAIAPGAEGEDDFGALLGETSSLGLNSHEEATEPLKLPEDSCGPDLAVSPGIEGGELTARERETLNEYARNSESAAPVREGLARENAAAQTPSYERILTIDAHDEVMTEAEREDIAWHEIRHSQIAQQMLTGTLDSIEQTSTGITVAVANYEGYRVVIPLKEMLVLPKQWPSKEERAETLERLPRFISMRLGSEIDFIVKGVDIKSRCAVASRRAAMMRKRQAFYMDKGDTDNPLIYPGRIVQARVVAVAEKIIRVEVFGVECTIRASDMSWEWIGNAKELYSVGDRVLVRVLTIDRPNVEDISITADIRSIYKNTTRDALKKCKLQCKYVGRVTDVFSGKTFIRLNNGANAVAYNCKDTRRPGRKDDVSFVVTRIDEDQGAAVGLITKIIRQNL